MTSKNRPPATSEVQEVSQRVKDTRKEIDTLKAELQKLINAGSTASVLKSPSKQNPQVASLEIAASNRDPGGNLPAAGLPSSNRFTTAQQAACSRNATNTVKPVAQKKVPSTSNVDLPSKKTRAYDVDEAREYIKKQKEKRAEQLKSQIKVEDNKLDLKRQKLKELQLKTRELVSKNVQMKRDRSKSRDKQEPIRLDKADLLKPSTARDHRSCSRDRFNLLKPPSAAQLQPRARSQERFEGSSTAGGLSSKFNHRPKSQDRAQLNTAFNQQQKSPPRLKPEHKSGQQREGRPKLRGNQPVHKQMENKHSRDPIARNIEAAQDKIDDVDNHHDLGKLDRKLIGERQPMDPNLLMPPEVLLEKSMMVFPENAPSNTLNNDGSPLQPQPQHPQSLLDHVATKSNMAARNVPTSDAIRKKEIETQTSETIENRNSANQKIDNKNLVDPPWLQPSTSTMPYPYNFINTVKRKLQDALHTPTKSSKSYVDVAIQSSLRTENIDDNNKRDDNKDNNVDNINDGCGRSSSKLDLAQGIIGSSSRPKSKEEIKEMLLKSAGSYRSHKHSKKQIEFKACAGDLELIPPPDADKTSNIPKTDAPPSGVARQLFLNNASPNVEDSASDTSKNIPEISTESALSSSNKLTTKNSLNYDNKTAEQRILDLGKINELKLVTRSRGNRCQSLTGGDTKTSKPNSDDSKVLSTILSLAENSYSSDFVRTNDSAPKSDSTLTNDRLSTKNNNSMPDIDSSFNHDSVVSSTKKSQKSRLSSENDSVTSSSAVNEILSAVEVTTNVNNVNSNGDQSKADTFKTLGSEAQPTRTPSFYNNNNNDDDDNNGRTVADSSVSEVLSTAVTSSADVDSEPKPSLLREPPVTLLDGKSKSHVAKSNSNGHDRMRTITIRPCASNSNNNVNEIHLKFEAEVHLLNDFNESLKQFKAVEEAFKHLQQNESATTVNTKVLQNVDTQTSFVTRDTADSVATATGTTTTSTINNNNPQSSVNGHLSSNVNGHLSSSNVKKSNSNHSLINYSRGSDILEELDDLNGAFLKKTDTTLSTTGLLDLSGRLNESAVSSKSDSQLQLSVSNIENEDFRHCTGLSLNMFEQLIKEEDARIEHLKVVIKIREQALLDRTKCELLSLDIKRKELLETGKLEEASLIKKKQRGILLKHEQERNEIKRLKQMQKDASKERKQILKQQRNVIKTQLSTKDMLLMMMSATGSSSRHHHQRRRQIQKSDNAATATVVVVGGGSANRDNFNGTSSNNGRRQSGPLRVVTSQSQLQLQQQHQQQQLQLQQSCSESIYSETSIVSRRSSVRNSLNGGAVAGGEEVLSVTSCSSKTTRSAAARVLLSSSSEMSDLDISGLQRLATLPAPLPPQEGAAAVPTTNHIQVADVKRALFMKEAALQRRRKEVEELLKWNQKLLEEEKKIAELEEAANAVITNQRVPPPVGVVATATPSDTTGAISFQHPNNRDRKALTTSTFVDDKQHNQQSSGTGTALGSHKFSGKQLNQLWKNMTGRDDKRYPDEKIYVMSQITLERFCKSARQFAARNRRNNTKSAEHSEDNESHLSGITGEPITQIIGQLDREKSNNNNNNNNVDDGNNDDSINIDSNKSMVSEEIDGYFSSDQDQYSSAFEPESVQEVLVINKSTIINNEEDKISSISELMDNFSRIEDEISLMSRNKTERNLDSVATLSEQMVQNEEFPEDFGQYKQKSSSVDPVQTFGIPFVESQSSVAKAAAKSVSSENLDKADSFMLDLKEADEISAVSRLGKTGHHDDDGGGGDLSRLDKNASRSFASNDNLDVLLSHEEIPMVMENLNNINNNNNNDEKINTTTTVISSIINNYAPPEDRNLEKVGQGQQQQVLSDSVTASIIAENISKDEGKVSSEREPRSFSRHSVAEDDVVDDECSTACEITEGGSSRSLDGEAQLEDKLSKEDVPLTFGNTGNRNHVVDPNVESPPSDSVKLSLHSDDDNHKKIATGEIEHGKLDETLLNQTTSSQLLLTRDSGDNSGPEREISKNQADQNQVLIQDQLGSGFSEIEEPNSSDNNTSNIISEEIELDLDSQPNTDSSQDILLNVEIDVRIESKKVPAVPPAEAAEKSENDGASFNLEQQLTSLAEILSTVESSIGQIPSANEKLTEKESSSVEPKEEDARSLSSEQSSKIAEDGIKFSEAETELVSAIHSPANEEEPIKTPAAAKIDVKKRVSEILADANLTRSGDKSPRFEDIYVTAYDVPTTASLSLDKRHHESPEPLNNEAKLLSNSDIFGTEAEELLRKQLAIEQEIKQLEEQQKEQQNRNHVPYAFVREIPNKPPPPYTPPSTSSSSSPSSSSLSPSSSVPQSILPQDPKEIDDVTNYTSKVLYKAYQLNNDLRHVKFSESSFRLISKMNTGKTCCEFLFNICRELAQEHYRQFVKLDEPSWLRVTKKPQLASPKPYNATALERYMNRKLKEHFGFRKVETKESSVIKWGRKKRDHVDEILVAKLQEEEPRWTNYDKDELLVKDQMVNEIMELLLKETGQVFKKILEKRRSDADLLLT